MKIKTKLILTYPKIALRNWRARVMAKKAAKEGNEERYPESWKNDYILKKSKKFLKLFKVNLIVEGFDSLPKAPAILAPNHASLLDAALMMAALENPDKASDSHNKEPLFLAKIELTKEKRVKGYLNLINTFFIDRNKPRQALEVMNDLARFAKDHRKYIVIFPEGTRSKDGKIGSFKSGAFRIAKKEFIPIIPVTINNSLSITDLSRTKKIDVTIKFHRAIKPMKFMDKDTSSIGASIKKIVEKSWVPPEGKRSKIEKEIV